MTAVRPWLAVLVVGAVLSTGCGGGTSGEPATPPKSYTKDAPVRADGRVELQFHARGPTGAQEEADLAALGAEVVARLPAVEGLDRPAGVILAWVPPDKVTDAAALPWVAAVTAPGFGQP
ncbi:MAG: hypothetical protein ACRD12_03780 [Acidimicrobiales bacterium]